MSVLRRSKILLVGPLTELSSGLIGGATVSFGQLITFLEREREPFVVVNTQRYQGGFKKYLNMPFILWQVLLHIASAKLIFLNSSRGGTTFLAPVLYAIARFSGRKFVFRPFGGDIRDYTMAYNGLQRRLFNNTTLRADLFFLQTRELMRYFAGSGARTAHLPTSRLPVAAHQLRKPRPFQRRFVFLGHVNQKKGIDELLEVASQLDDSFCIHIYGPIVEERYRAIFRERRGIYQGVLPACELMPTLAGYDVLILPTRYEGEGYPGSIIEAYALGLPVITTHWKAIPEIVEHGRTGLLIAPGATLELREAMYFFNEHNYPEFSQHAYELFQSRFDTNIVLKNAMKAVKDLS